MEVANASMYDGSTAAAEAVMMAVRLTGRRSVLVAQSLHPEYREVLETYASQQGMPMSVTPTLTAAALISRNSRRHYRGNCLCSDPVA